MKVAKKRAAVMFFMEHIEMDVFASEDSLPLEQFQESQLNNPVPEQSHLEHPLVPLKEDVYQPQKQRTTPATAPPTNTERAEATPPMVDLEMEVFPPSEVKGDDSLVMSTTPEPTAPTPPQSRAAKLKWRRPASEQRGLVVKDVFCLPSGHFQGQEVGVLWGKERAALAAAGLAARLTISSSWCAQEMESRLTCLFRGRSCSGPGQRFRITYLQCVQGSRVLFTPNPPPQSGWTGEQVLKITGHGPLYILSHQDYAQTGCDWQANRTRAVNRQEFCAEVSNDGSHDDDDDSEGEARAGSPSPPTAGREETLSLDAVLRLYREQYTTPEVQTGVRVRRTDVLSSAFRVLKKPWFSFRNTPILHFMGEEVPGHEGPLREFFRLALLELQESSLMEGRPGRLLLTNDLAALEDRRYFAAGVLVGWSLAQGGPGPHCLHPALYQLMCGLSPSLEDFSWEEVADADVQVRLRQLRSCASVDRLSLSLCEWVAGCGVPGIYTAHARDLPSIYTRVVRYYIYHRTASMISQFTEGLNSCGGLWDIMKAHSAAFLTVMTHTVQPVSLESFRGMFQLSWSPPESHLRAAEETTVSCWERLLSMVNENQTIFSFEDLLAFITGADHLPPLGFSSDLSLRFFSQDPAMLSVRLPYASTCSMELFLPRGMSSPATLRDLLTRAVHESLGFGDIHTD